MYSSLISHLIRSYTTSDSLKRFNAIFSTITYCFESVWLVSFTKTLSYRTSRRTRLTFISQNDHHLRWHYSGVCLAMWERAVSSFTSERRSKRPCLSHLRPPVLPPSSARRNRSYCSIRSCASAFLVPAEHLRFTSDALASTYCRHQMAVQLLMSYP